MATINNAEKKIILKIVFYGPGLSGKTTAVEAISAKYNGSNLRGEKNIASGLDGQVDQSILNQAENTDDYLVELGKIRGFDVQVNLISVPGMVYHNAARQLLIRDLDGILFVADSQRERLDANRFSILQMRDNLYEELRGNTSEFPVVIMYNKRDMPNAATIEELEEKVNVYKTYSYIETVATTGQGISDAFKKICSMAIKRLG